MGFYNLKNRTERLLKSNKNNQKFHGSNFITKTTNSFQNFSKNLSQKILLFRLFKLASRFTWVLKRARTPIRTYSVKTSF